MNNVIVVASGKGGTGKSTVCICLSVSLVKQGKRVLLIDCDCGMRGLDIMLDIEQDILFDASDAVCGNCGFGEAVYKSKNNDNLFLMAAPFDAENELSPSVFRQLVDAVKGGFDYVIIDSPAGIGSGFVTAAAPADRALIVTNAEPTSVRGAVKVRKRLEALGIGDARLVINRFDKRVFKSSGFIPTSTRSSTRLRLSSFRSCRLTSTFRSSCKRAQQALKAVPRSPRSKDSPGA